MPLVATDASSMYEQCSKLGQTITRQWGGTCAGAACGAHPLWPPGGRPTPLPVHARSQTPLTPACCNQIAVAVPFVALRVVPSVHTTGSCAPVHQGHQSKAPQFQPNSMVGASPAAGFVPVEQGQQVLLLHWPCPRHGPRQCAPASRACLPPPPRQQPAASYAPSTDCCGTAGKGTPNQNLPHCLHNSLQSCSAGFLKAFMGLVASRPVALHGGLARPPGNT